MGSFGLSKADYDGTGNVTKKGYPKDYSSKNTINQSAKYKLERDARNVRGQNWVKNLFRSN